MATDGFSIFGSMLTTVGLAKSESWLKKETIKWAKLGLMSPGLKFLILRTAKIE